MTTEWFVGVFGVGGTILRCDFYANHCTATPKMTQKSIFLELVIMIFLGTNIAWVLMANVAGYITVSDVLPKNVVFRTFPWQPP